MRSTFSDAASILVAALLVVGCGGDGSEPSAPAPVVKETGRGDTPAAAIQGMLALAEAGNWETYVSTYYGEKHKMTDLDAQIPQVAARLVKAGPKLIEMLEGCVGQAPALSEDGSTATYANGFKLHRDNGKWGFHL